MPRGVYERKKQPANNKAKRPNDGRKIRYKKLRGEVAVFRGEVVTQEMFDKQVSLNNQLMQEIADRKTKQWNEDRKEIIQLKIENAAFRDTIVNILSSIPELVKAGIFELKDEILKGEKEE